MNPSQICTVSMISFFFVHCYFTGGEFLPPERQMRFSWYKTSISRTPEAFLVPGRFS